MQDAHLYCVPSGARGFDCNFHVTPEIARQRRAKGETFCARYVRREQRHDYDLTRSEVDTILNAGLGLIVVQHVAPEGWVPSAALGVKYGTIAADETTTLLLPPGTMVTLDLEGVKVGTPAREVIAYCNNWHSVVASAGFMPLLYVGFDPGLTAKQLYHDLRFTRYWGAYNIRERWVPAVRGFCLQQGTDPNHDFDRDVATTDALGGCAVVLARAGWTGRQRTGVARKRRKRAKATTR